MTRVIFVHGLGVSPRYFGPLQAELPAAEAPDLRPLTTLPALADALEEAVGGPPATASSSASASAGSVVSGRRSGASAAGSSACSGPK